MYNTVNVSSHETWLEAYHRSLLQRSPFQLSKSILIYPDSKTSPQLFPRGHIQTLTSAFLAKHKGASFVPECVSVTHFISQLYEYLLSQTSHIRSTAAFNQQASLPSIAPHLLEMLISSKLNNQTYPHLHPYHQASYASLFLQSYPSNEESLSLQEWLEDPKQALENISRSLKAESLESHMLLERLEALQKLWSELLAILQANHLTIPWSQLVRKIKASHDCITQNPKAFLQWIKRFSFIDVCGFVYFSQVESWLLQTLRKVPQLTVYLSQTTQGSQAKHISTRTGTGTQRQHALLRCSSLREELTSVFALAASAIQSGIAPHNIAILLPQDEDYLAFSKYMQHLPEYHISVEISQKITLKQTPIASLLSGLKHFLHSFQRIYDFYRLLDPMLLSYLRESYIKRLRRIQPDLRGDSIQCYLSTRLQEWVDIYIQSKPLNAFFCIYAPKPPELKEAIKKLADHLANDHVLTRATTTIFAKDFCAFAQKSLKKLYDTNTPTSLLEYLDILEKFCTKYLQCNAFPEKENTKQALDQLFLDMKYVHSLKHAENTLHQMVQKPQLLATLLSSLQHYPLKISPNPLQGLQILPFSKGVMLPFQMVLVCGVHKDLTFRTDWDEIITPTLQQKTQLLAKDIFTDTMGFSMLWNHVPKLLFSYTQENAKNSYDISPFLIKTYFRNQSDNHKHVFESKDFVQLLRHMDIYKSQTPPASLPSIPSNSRNIVSLPSFLPRTSLWHSISATALKAILHCPYAFFLQKHYLKDLGLPETHDKLAIGNYFDKLIDTFFLGYNNTKHPLSSVTTLPALNKESHLSEKALFKRLYKIHHLLITHTSFVTPALHFALNFDHLASLAHWYGDFFAHFGYPDKVDVQYDLKHIKTSFHPKDHDTPGDSTSISGKIDLFLQYKDFRIAIDYKSNTLPSRKPLKDGLEPQLILYARALENSVDNLVLAYYSIQKRQTMWLYVPESLAHVNFFQNPKPIIKTKKELDSIQQKIHKTWSHHKNHIEKNNHVEVIPSQYCKLCNYQGVCRKHMN